MQNATDHPPVDFILSPWASKAIKMWFHCVKLCLTLLPTHSLLNHSTRKFAEQRRKEKGREECNNPLGPASFFVYIFTKQVARSTNQLFVFSCTFLFGSNNNKNSQPVDLLKNTQSQTKLKKTKPNQQTNKQIKPQKPNPALPPPKKTKQKPNQTH